MSENNNEQSLQDPANNDDNNEMENESNQNKTFTDINTLMKDIDLNSLLKNVDLNALVSQRNNMTKNEPANDGSSLVRSMNLLSSLMKATSSLKNNDLLKNSVQEPGKTVESPIEQQNSTQSSVKNDHADFALLIEKLDQILPNVLEIKESLANELSEIKYELAEVRKQNNYLIERKNRKRKRNPE